MAGSIHVINPRLKNKWDTDPKGTFTIGDMATDQWVAQNEDFKKQTLRDLLGPSASDDLVKKYPIGENDYKLFWAARDEKVKQYAAAIAKSQRVKDTPFTSALNLLDVQNQSSLEQVIGAREEWEKLIDLQHGKSGSIFGFDTETFGDISGNKGIFGITEFAIAERQFENGVGINKNGVSLAIGINEQQASYLRNLVRKFENNGWNSLDISEQVSLERMSMAGYSNNWQTVFRQESIDLLGGKKMYIIHSLGDTSFSAAKMRAGIKNYHDLYNFGKADAASVITEGMSFLQQQLEAGNPLAGANISFDVNSTGNVLHSLGITKFDDTLETMSSKMLDIVNATRSVADITTQSVGRLTGEAHKYSGGASVQSLLDAFNIQVSQSHVGYKDDYNELEILDSRNFKDANSYAEYIQRHVRRYTTDNGPMIDAPRYQEHKIDDSVFLIKRGSLDKTKMDVVSRHISDDVEEFTNSFSITNEFWGIDKESTGYIEDDKFILTMSNTYDQETGHKVTKFSKEFSSQEEALEWLQQQEIYSKSQIFGTKGNTSTVKNQMGIKVKDFGRREFDKSINPSDIRVDGTKEVYGFEALERYVDLSKKIDFESAGIDLSSGLNYRKTEDFVMQYAKENNIKMTSYEAEAFVGMYDKLKTEQPLLEKIIESVNGNSRTKDNLSKTISFRNAYEQAIAEFDSKYTRKASKYRATISDVFGVDLNIGTEDAPQYRRINGQNVKSATSDVNRIFGNLSHDEQIELLEQLKGYGILSEDETSNLTKAIKNTIEVNGDASKRKALQSISEGNPAYQIYQDIGYAINRAVNKYNTTDSSIVTQFEDDGSPYIKYHLMENVQDEHVIKYKKGSISSIMSSASDAEKESLDMLIKDAVYESPTITLVPGTDSEAFKSTIKGLTENLNYGSDVSVIDGKIEHNLIEEMFTAPGDYGLNKYAKDGIQSVIMQPSKDSNAYMFITNQEHYASLIDELSRGTYDFKSYASLLASGGTDHGMVVELPYITRHTVSEDISSAMQDMLGHEKAEITTVKQGENFEEFLISKFNVYTKNGRVHGYINNGVYDYLSSFRMSAGRAITENLLGDTVDFATASRVVRYTQNQKLQNLSASASYRGYYDAVTGTYKRMTNYGAGDFIYAYQVDLGKGLQETFNAMISDSNPGQVAENVATGTVRAYSDVDKLIDLFGDALGIQKGKKSNYDYRMSIVKDTRFQEFFNKNLFAGTLEDDSFLSSSSLRDKNIFSIMKDIIDSDTTGLFDDSIKKAFTKIDAAQPHINQLLSHTAMEKGIVSLIKPGVYDDNAGLYSTMRPTYLQQNLGMMFDPKTEWDTRLAHSEKVSGLGLGFRAGSVVETKEYNSAKNLIKESYSTGKAGTNYALQERHIMGVFGQVNDFDLQSRYQSINTPVGTAKTRLQSILEANGFDIAHADEFLSYIRQDMNSVNEGKWFIDPKLAEQEFIRSSDLKKINVFNVDSMDMKSTAQILEGLEGKTLKRNTVIGKTLNGTSIVYNNVDIILDSQNIESLLRDGTTYATTLTPDITDPKLMLNGAEKATAHSISVSKFMDKFGITDRKRTLDLLSDIFNEISLGAGVIGNVNVAKHRNPIAFDSRWKLLTTMYVDNNQGYKLVDALNGILENSQKEGKYTDIGHFSFSEKEMKVISDTSREGRLASFLDDVWKSLTDNEPMWDANLNKRIIDIQDYLVKHNMTYGAFQRNNMNEHVADFVKLDKRLEQSIRMRDFYNITDEVNGIWADELKDYARNYDSSIISAPEEFSGTTSIFNKYNRSMNAERLQNIRAQGQLQRSIKGDIESLMYYLNPNKYNSENVVKVSLQDAMKFEIPKSGITVADLETSLFFIDGRPSQYLQSLEKDGQLLSKSNSLYLDFGETVYVGTGANKRQLKGMYVPILNVNSNASNELFFQEQQGNLARFLNRYREIMNTGMDKNKLSIAVENYMDGIKKSLAVQSKDSDFYKALQKIIMPHSGGFLAGQEVPALFDEMMTDSQRQLMKRKSEIESELSYKKLELDEIKARTSELDSINKSLKDSFADIAKRVRDGEYLEPTSLKGTGLEGITREILPDGTIKNGFVVGTSAQGFRELGYDFGQISYDLVREYQENGGKNIPIRNIDKLGNSRFNISEKEIARIESELRSLSGTKGFEKLEITDSKHLTRNLEDYFISIKDLNEDIVRNRTKRILNIFEGNADKQIGIGYDFMRTVGTFGEAPRYPIFRSQQMARFILDDTVSGSHMNIYTPIGSSLSNVDFDGDLLYFFSKVNGASIFMSDTKTYQNMYNAYTSTLDETKKTLAELIEGGDALKVTDINNIREQSSQYLEMFFKSDFDKISDATSIKMFGKSYASLTDAEQFAVRVSEKVYDKFLSVNGNSLTNEQIMKASLAPNLRKINIGAISTPSFTIRDVGMEIYKDIQKNGTEKELKGITEIMLDLSNMGSKNGGLTDIAEQLGIDTKHALDAMSTSETIRFSAGMNTLFGGYSLARKNADLVSNQTEGLTSITKALYNNVFKDTQKRFSNTDAGVASIVGEVIANLDNREILAASEDANAKLGLRALIKLQTFYGNDISSTTKISSRYMNTLRKMNNTADSEILRTLEELMTKDVDIFHGTNFEEVMKIIQNSGYSSGEMFKFSDKTKLYYGIGSVGTKGDWGDYVYQFTGMTEKNGKYAPVFNRYKYDRALGSISIDTEGYTFGTYYPDMSKMNRSKAINQALSGGTFDFSEYELLHTDNPIYRNKITSTLDVQRKAKTLDYIFTSEGNILSAQKALSNYQEILDLTNSSSPAVKQAFGDTLVEINQLFAMTRGNSKTSSDQVSSVIDMLQGYEYAIAEHSFSKNTPTGAELIKSINQSIANNPEKYFNKDGGFIEDYDSIVRKTIDSRLGNVEGRAEYYATKARGLQGFDIAKYNKTINGLNGNLYDIISESKKLSGTYDNFESHFSEYKDLDDVVKVLEKRSDDIDELTSTLTKKNDALVSSTESTIYKLFKDRQQISAVFNWNELSGDSKIGFGKYIGKSFKKLNEADIKEILSTSKSGLTGKEKYAYEQTISMLTQYQSQGHNLPIRSALQYRESSEELKAVQEILSSKQQAIDVNIKNADAFKESVEQGVKDGAKAAQEAGQTIKRKTLSGSFFDTAKTLSQNVTGKHIAIAGAALAALGVVNGITHNQKTQSPLTPTRNSTNNSPDISSPPRGSMSQSPAGAQQRRTVYHDNATGLNFKVSAKTRNMMEAQAYGNMVNRAGGGNATVNINNDNSGITDNWLENKFAQLSN